MYRVTAQTKKTQLGMYGIFERDITIAKNAKEARAFFKATYQPLLEERHGKIKILGVEKV